MRNLTEEQVDTIAFNILDAFLGDGVPFSTVVEATDDELEDDHDTEEPTDGDYRAVRDRVDSLLSDLQTIFNANF